MKKQDQRLIVILGIAAVVIAAIMTKNISKIIHPGPQALVIDAAKVKEDLLKAGLTLREAKFWETIQEQ